MDVGIELPPARREDGVVVVVSPILFHDIKGDEEVGVELQKVCFVGPEGDMLLLPLYFGFHDGFITG